MIISSVPNSNSNNGSSNGSSAIRYIDLRNPTFQWVILKDAPVNPVMQIRISNIALPSGCVTIEEWAGVEW